MPLHIIRQDITQMNVEAIVNTTNEELVGFSGVDYAIHQAAGPELDEECKRLVPLDLGFAKITSGYELKCKYIIHTSGPIWMGGKRGEKAILKSCYIESLKLADKYHCESIAFPLISAGTYGYPKDQVLSYAVQVISEFLLDNEMDVYLCVFDRDSYEFSRQRYSEIKTFIDDGYADEAHNVGDFDFMSKQRSKPKSKRVCKEVNCFEEREQLELDRPCQCREIKINSAANKSIDEYLKQMDMTFAYTLLDLIIKRGMTEVECYKKANIDRKTFSKIKSNPNTYKPSKQTAVAFAIALELDLDETQQLLATAGLTLSKSLKFDKIIRFFIQNENYNIYEINEALFEFDQVLLGC